MGFYKIDNDVLLMLTAAFTVFFLGTLPYNFRVYQFTNYDNNSLLNTYNIKLIKKFLYIVGFLGILQALYYFRQGIFLNPNSDVEGIMGNGPIGHLLLASYSVLPIYFLNWTYKRNIRDLIPVLMVLIVAFSSFIKYNIIGPVIIIFIFVCLYKHSIEKKAILWVSFFVIFFFISNYAIGFIISGSEVSSNFYIAHFWKYFAGSLIYDNYIFTSGCRVDISIFYKIMSFWFALPNMFISKIFGVELFPPAWGPGMKEVSNFGEESNVNDVFGYLYPSKGDFGDVLWYLIVIFLTSIFFSYLYIRKCNDRKKYSPFIAAFLTYFLFLDFFSPFFVLSGPWEILIWALLLPQFFRKRRHVKMKY